MRLPRLRWSLPLLGRELVEMSKRRRTYVLRTLCALLAGSLLGFFLLAIQPQIRLVGEGRIMVEVAIWLLACVIALILPASCANSVLREKEQGTLVLLFLTPIGPWRLVMQKWLSSVVSMASLLLTFLPVLALAYAYGGVETGDLLTKCVGLMLLILLVAAVGITASCLCQGMISALLVTYVVLSLQCGVLGWLLDFLNPWHLSNRLRGYDLSWFSWSSPLPLLWDDVRGAYHGLGYPASYLPTVLSIGCYLAIARFFLTRIPAQPGPSMLLRVFRAIDRRFEAIDAHFGRRYQRELPGDQGVYWRETHRRSFTSPRYMVRLLVIPVTSSLLIAAVAPLATFNIVLSAVLAFLVISNATAFERDRRDQGLDVILSTPLSARGFVRQKARAQSRFRWILSIWLLVLTAIDGMSFPSGWALRLPFEVSSAILLPGIVSWYAFSLGLRIRNRLLVLLLAFLPLLVWFFVLPMLIYAIDPIKGLSPRLLSNLVSPLMFMFDIDDMQEFTDRFGVMGCATLELVYLLLYALLRRACLTRRAEAYQRML